MKVYVSGPMTGLPNLNFSAFKAATTELRALGHDVVDPCEYGESDPGREWADYLKQDIVAMLGCDGVALLDGWESSRGATLERHIALALGMDVRPLDHWINPTRSVEAAS